MPSAVRCLLRCVEMTVMHMVLVSAVESESEIDIEGLIIIDDVGSLGDRTPRLLRVRGATGWECGCIASKPDISLSNRQGPTPKPSRPR